jgi:hypothetical protein
MTEVKTLTENQFDEQFTLVENHIDNNASWGGAMFETFGEELDYVRMKAQKGNNVWTIIEGDDDSMFIVNGVHFVNRIGYLITREEWTEETEVEIDLYGID